MPTMVLSMLLMHPSLDSILDSCAWQKRRRRLQNPIHS